MTVPVTGLPLAAFSVTDVLPVFLVAPRLIDTLAGAAGWTTGGVAAGGCTTGGVNGVNAIGVSVSWLAVECEWARHV